MHAATEHLLLVPIGREHAEDLYRLHQDPWVASWYGETWTRDQAAAFASACARAWMSDGVGKWMAYERSSGHLAGRGGLSRLPADAPATEVGRAALSFAAGELRASPVIAFTERHNLASRRVMEKLNLSLAGEIRTRGLVEGRSDVRDDARFVVFATQGTRPRPGQELR